MAIQVSLNTSGNPAVTVNPVVQNVNSGNQTITWSVAQNQNFTFVGVAFLSGQSQFTNLTISQNGTQMTVQENNNSSGTNYPYVIMVQQNGVDYCSISTTSLPGNGGTPTIHNN